MCERVNRSWSTSKVATLRDLHNTSWTSKMEGNKWSIILDNNKSVAKLCLLWLRIQLLFSEHLGEISHCYNFGYADHRWPFHPILGIDAITGGVSMAITILSYGLPRPRAPAMKCHVELGQTGLGVGWERGHWVSFSPNVLWPQTGIWRVLCRVQIIWAYYSAVQCRQVECLL